jgi:predicted  nucleic acid-binding Zn-ribbon protein
LKEQLILLEELQRHDARIQEMESSLRALPTKLKLLEADLGTVEAMLTKERSGLAETERYRSEQEASIKSSEQLVGKSKAKLTQVKNNKEYMATQRELEASRKAISDREEEILKLMEAIEATRKSIGDHEGDVNRLREMVERERGSIQGRITELESQLATARVGRGEVAKRVKPDILKRYGAIRMRRGLAIVPVQEGVCRGCNMAIPPQLYNQLHRANSLETCPQCNRLIYWSKIMEEKRQEEGEAAPATPSPEQ